MPEQDSITEAHELAVRAHIAARAFASATQEDVDRITAAMARAGTAAAERLGKLAAEETGYGRAAHKTFKNVFNTQYVYEGFQHERTVGVIENDPQKRVITIAEPVGVIAGLVPVTNPTSTVLFKALIAAKTRNAVVFAPHPRAVRSSGESARVMQEAAQEAGAPADLFQSMSRVSVAGTDALMRHHRTDLVLATGSRAMVLAAYSSGKPTYAVGPGNVPAYINASVRDVDYAARCIMAAKVFDWGTACASEQSAIVDRPIAAQLQASMEAKGAYFLTDAEQNQLTTLLFPQGGRGPSNVEAVSQSPATLAHLAGFAIPESTQLLVVRPGGIGYDFPLSREILGPVFKFIEVEGPDEGIATAVAQLRFGGDGHTAAVHAHDEAIISRYAEAAPAYRVLVNTPSLFGAMGYSTGVDRTFMIGTGTIGGSISSDNIGVRHLINRKRVAAQIHDWEMPPSGADDLRVAQWALNREPVAGPATASRPYPSSTPSRTPAPAPATAAAPAPPPVGASLEDLVRNAIEAVMRDA
ncbi:MAG TPA: aldehyde dehydrogenase family protein [Gaiellales bacterium]